MPHVCLGSRMQNTNPEDGSPLTSGIEDMYFMIGMLPIIFGIPQSLLFLLFWNWFIKPLGLPGIGYWQAFGLMLFVSFIRYEERKSDIKSNGGDTRWFIPIRRQYGYYFLFLLMGFVGHLLLSRSS